MAKARTKKQKLKKAVFTLATLGLLGVVGTKIAQRIIRGRDDDKDGAKQEQPATQQRDFMTMAMEEYYPEVFIAVEELETNQAIEKGNQFKKQSGIGNNPIYISKERVKITVIMGQGLKTIL